MVPEMVASDAASRNGPCVSAVQGSRLRPSPGSGRRVHSSAAGTGPKGTGFPRLGRSDPRRRQPRDIRNEDAVEWRHDGLGDARCSGRYRRSLPIGRRVRRWMPRLRPETRRRPRRVHLGPARPRHSLGSERAGRRQALHGLPPTPRASRCEPEAGCWVSCSPLLPLSSDLVWQALASALATRLGHGSGSSALPALAAASKRIHQPQVLAPLAPNCASILGACAGEGRCEAPPDSWVVVRSPDSAVSARTGLGQGSDANTT